jgi:hypothetical protein
MNIESGIPIPPQHHSKIGPAVRAMKVGESIHFTSHRDSEHARVVGYRVGFKMSTRKLKDGWRIWRRA